MGSWKRAKQTWDDAKREVEESREKQRKEFEYKAQKRADEQRQSRRNG